MCASGANYNASYAIQAALLRSLASVKFCVYYGMYACLIALLGIVATPSGSSISYVQDFHALFGFVVFVAQATLSLHYLIKAWGDILDWSLLLLQLIAIGLVVPSFYAVGVMSLMLPVQLLAIIAFGALLIWAVSYKASQDGAMSPHRVGAPDRISANASSAQPCSVQAPARGFATPNLHSLRSLLRFSSRLNAPYKKGQTS